MRDPVLALPLAALTACAAAQSPDLAPVREVLPALLDDAARRSGVSASNLRVLSVEAVTWSDGSLGCPRDGLLAVQVLTPGYRLRIAPSAGSPVLDYHTALRGNWVWCPPGRAEPALPREGPARM